jgi:hypothetical protein
MAAAWDRIAERGDEDRISYRHRAHESSRHAPIPVHGAERTNTCPLLCACVVLCCLCGRCCAVAPCSVELRLQTPLQSTEMDKGEERREQGRGGQASPAEDTRGALAARFCHVARPAQFDSRRVGVSIQCRRSQRNAARGCCSSKADSSA